MYIHERSPFGKTTEYEHTTYVFRGFVVVNLFFLLSHPKEKMMIEIYQKLKIYVRRRYAERDDISSALLESVLGSGKGLISINIQIPRTTSAQTA